MGLFVRFFVTLDASEIGSLTAFSFAFIVGVCFTQTSSTSVCFTQASSTSINDIVLLNSSLFLLPAFSKYMDFLLVISLLYLSRISLLDLTLNLAEEEVNICFIYASFR